MLLTRRALNRALLAHQLLLAREKITPQKAIEQLAGLQAQEPKPPYLALWTRVDGFTRDALHEAIASRKVVRGTMMRGTLHLVSRNDYLAWRPTLQPVLTRIAAAIAKKPFGVEELCATARAFFDEEPRPFDALRAIFPKGDERLMAYAVRMHLPLLMVPDDSPWSYPANAPFAVAETFLQAKLKPPSLPSLVLRYLAAFGPATPADFQNWSGLGSAKAVFEELRPKLETFRDEKKRELFDLPKAPRPDEETEAPVRLLPEFDSAILGHADRSRIIADEHRPRVATKNLRILPTFLVDGFVAGTWAIVKKKLELTPFGKLDKRTRAALEEEGERLVRFVSEGPR
jgi:Winged helix DNA-binding domain